MLVLVGCCFYAVSNLGQEYLVKTFDRFEFLGMLGLCGSLISAAQIAAIETDALRKVEWTGQLIHACRCACARVHVQRESNRKNTTQLEDKRVRPAWRTDHPSLRSRVRLAVVST